MAEKRRPNAGDGAPPPAEAPIPAPAHRPFPRWLIAVWIVFAAWAAWYLVTNLRRG